MKVVIQRVANASVDIENYNIGNIGKGYMILVGFEESDNEEDIDWLSKKIINLRLFDDQAGVMNKSIMEVDGNILLVSQFTLHALTAKGNRPSYIRAAKPEIAIPLYEKFIQKLEILLDKKIQTGRFGENMQVAIINDGPVTIIIDTKDKK